MGVTGIVRGLVARVDTERTAALAEALRAEAERGGSLPRDAGQRRSFDRLMDALNRLPRPAMALGTVVLIGAAMVAPEWFSARMQALAGMPEALWWLIGAVISLFFGSRIQTQGQAFQRSLAETLAQSGMDMPEVPAFATTPQVADSSPDARVSAAVIEPGINPALAIWQASDGTPR